MTKKPIYLRDLVLSCHEHHIDHELNANNVYFIGRNPQAIQPRIDPRFVIKALDKYDPTESEDKTKLQRGFSVSRLQGTLRMDERGLLFFHQVSRASSSYQISHQEINMHELDFRQLEHMLDPNHLVHQAQVYPGDLLVFSRDRKFPYAFLYLPVPRDKRAQRERQEAKHEFEDGDTGIYAVVEGKLVRSTVH